MNFSLTRIIQKRHVLVFNQVKQLQNSQTLIIKSRLSTESKASDIEDEFEDPNFTIEREEKRENEEKFIELIEHKRNVSRFPTGKVETKFYNRVPMLTSDSWKLSQPKYFRKIYAKHGNQTQIDPGVCWPTKDELQEIIDDEKTYDLDLENKIKTVAESKYKDIDRLRKK